MTRLTKCGRCGATVLGVVRSCAGCGNRDVYPLADRVPAVSFRRIPCSCGGCKVMARKGLINMYTINCAQGAEWAYAQ